MRMFNIFTRILLNRFFFSFFFYTPSFQLGNFEEYIYSHRRILHYDVTGHLLNVIATSSIYDFKPMYASKFTSTPSLFAVAFAHVGVVMETGKCEKPTSLVFLNQQPKKKKEEDIRECGKIVKSFSFST